jgi:hypothetical protein
MKKTILFLVGFSVAFFNSMAHANEDKKVLLQSVDERAPDRIYFGPELFCYQLDTHVNGVKVHGNRFFAGLNLGYEHIKPENLYAGIDFLYAFSADDLKASYHHHSVSWDKADKGFGHLELRVGYAFAPHNWIAIPFLGMGTYNVYNIDHHDHQGFKQAIPYVAAGVRSEYVFRDRFHLGINAKLLRSIGANQEFRYKGGKATTHDNMWGAEIGVPFVWNIDCQKRWDIQVEPYFLTLDFSQVQNIYGARVLAAYRF